MKLASEWEPSLSTSSFPVQEVKIIIKCEHQTLLCGFFDPQMEGYINAKCSNYL